MKNAFLTRTVIIFAVTFCLLSNLSAQIEQVAFAPGIFEITAEMQKDYGILEAYSNGFRRAILNRDDSGEYFVVVSFVENRQSFTETYGISQDQLNEIRRKLAESPVKSAEKDEATNQGRFYLVTSSTLGSIYQGTIMSTAMRKTVTYEDPWSGFSYTSREPTNFSRAFPFFLSAGVFTSSLLISKDKNIRSSSANMHLFGSSMGLAHGALANLLIFGDDPYNRDGAYIILSGISIAEGWGMYLVSQKNKFDYARSMAWNTGNIWGTGSGLLIYTVAFGNAEFEPRGFAASGLLGAAGGVFLFDALYKSNIRTPGDYRAINALAFPGFGFGFALALEMNEVRGVGAVLLGGVASGLAIGYTSTANTSFTRLEGGLIALGTFTGGLLGGAVSILAEPQAESTSVYLVSIGGAIGWATTYFYFKSQEKDLGRIGLGGENGPDFNLSFNPLGLAYFNKGYAGRAHSNSGHLYGAESVRFSLRF